MSGLIGKKLGMTQIFTGDGEAVGVTVIEAGPCPVVQVKTPERDGYSAVQLGFGKVRESRVKSPEAGHAARAGLDYVPSELAEFAPEEGEEYEPGQEITVSIFEPGERVKVSGDSKGRGFQGPVKRHGFGGGRASHGGSAVLRKPGSIGPGTDPSRVIKGRKMAGRMGGTRTTVENLRVERVDPERNLLLVRGSVPGARNNILYIRREA
jgi:large subunit ribosomal protein L3